MKVTVRYDLGAGPVDRVISPRAMVGWELATKSKMSDLAQGIAMGDLVTMLYHQMKADGDAPASQADLLDALVEIGPELDGSVPTSPDPEPSSVT